MMGFCSFYWWVKHKEKHGLHQQLTLALDKYWKAWYLVAVFMGTKVGLYIRKAHGLDAVMKSVTISSLVSMTLDLFSPEISLCIAVRL